MTASGPVAARHASSGDVSDDDYHLAMLRAFSFAALGILIFFLVIDAIPMSIFAKDRQSRYVMVNQYMADFYEKTKEDLLRRHTSELPAPDETRQKSLRDDAWVFSNLAVLDQPLAMLQRPDGAFVPFHSTKIPLFNDDGELIGLLGVNRDITEDRRAQEQLRASRRLLEIVIDSIPMFIFVKDLQGRHMLINQWSANYFGTTKEAILAGGSFNLPLSEETRTVVLGEDEWVFKNRETLVITDEFVREVSTRDAGRAPLSGYLEDAREATQILLRNLEKAGEIIRSFKQVAADQASSQRRAFAVNEVVE